MNKQKWEYIQLFEIVSFNGNIWIGNMVWRSYLNQINKFEGKVL